jgi:hypothetical protein
MDALERRALVDELKAALVAEVSTLITTTTEENAAIIHKVIADQLEMRAELASLKTRVDESAARHTAAEARFTTHESVHAELRTEMTRKLSDHTNEVKNMVDSAFGQVSGAVGGLDKKFSSELRTTVQGVLGEQVTELTEAASKLTKSPRVKAAAAVGGTFAASAAMQVILEIWKLVHPH